jgi:hypothetical protein
MSHLPDIAIALIIRGHKRRSVVGYCHRANRDVFLWDEFMGARALAQVPELDTSVLIA